MSELITILSISVALLAVFAAYGLWYWRRQARAAEARLRDGPRPPDPRERERIAAEERAKIFRDLHDDIGVKLLALLHTVGDVRQADLVRSIIYDMRDIVSRSRRPPGTLLEVLAQIRDEMEQRLEAFAVELDWRQDPATPDVAMAGPSALNLFRIMREAVTNAVRHAGASTMAVNIRVREQSLVFEIANNRVGVRRQTAAGAGTLGMQERAASLGGSVNWINDPSGGVTVMLEVALDALRAVK